MLFESTYTCFQERIAWYFLHLLYRMRDARLPAVADPLSLTPDLSQSLTTWDPAAHAPGQSDHTTLNNPDGTVPAVDPGSLTAFEPG